MREIKFRAWHIQNEIMYDNVQLDWNINKMDTDSTFVVMQYTGLKDTSFDPVEIYEGDLFGTEGEVFGEVYFDTDFAGFCVKYPNGGWTTLGEHLLNKQNHTEVVGNIYED